MATSSLADVWFDRAMEAMSKNDLKTAETRLLISLQLHPDSSKEALLNTVQTHMKKNTPGIKSVMDKHDIEQCIVIAKIALERRDIVVAKKFFTIANRCYPNGYAERMLKKIHNLQRQKETACNLYRRATLEFELGNLRTSEKILIQAQKKFPRTDAERLLELVRSQLAEQNRRNRENRANRPFFIRLKAFALSILTCNCFKGYALFSNEENTDNNDSNHRSTFYCHTAGNIPHSSHNVYENRRTNNSDNNRSTRYQFTSENIPRNKFNARNTDNSRNTNNDSSNRENNRERNSNSDHGGGIPNSNNNIHDNWRNAGSNTNNNNNRSTRYQFTSENIPRNTFNARNTDNSRNTNNDSSNRENNRERNSNSDHGGGIPNSNHNIHDNWRNAGSNTNNNNNRSTRYQFTSENIPRNTFNARNTDYSRNTKRNKNNVGSKNADSSRTREGSSWRNVFKNDKPYTKEQLLEVSRVIESKDDYGRLGLRKGATLTEKDVHKAYRQLGRLLHPDKNKAPKAKEAFIIIGEAKDRLLKTIK